MDLNCSCDAPNLPGVTNTPNLPGVTSIKNHIYPSRCTDFSDNRSQFIVGNEIYISRSKKSKALILTTMPIEGQETFFCGYLVGTPRIQIDAAKRDKAFTIAVNKTMHIVYVLLAAT